MIPFPRRTAFTRQRQLRRAEVEVLALFAAWSAVLAAGHGVADHLQPDEVSNRKGAPEPEKVAQGAWRHRGWGAAAVHVMQYHAIMLAVCAAGSTVLPIRCSPSGAAWALALSLGTHAVIDRRWPTTRLLRAVGAPKFAETRLGHYTTDQSLHRLVLAACAVILARSRPGSA